jgi:hypothetical protein
MKQQFVVAHTILALLDSWVTNTPSVKTYQNLQFCRFLRYNLAVQHKDCLQHKSVRRVWTRGGVCCVRGMFGKVRYALQIKWEGIEMLNVDCFFHWSAIFPPTSTFILLSRLGTCHNEAVEMSIREWLRIHCHDLCDSWILKILRQGLNGAV